MWKKCTFKIREIWSFALQSQAALGRLLTWVNVDQASKSVTSLKSWRLHLNSSASFLNS